jgi:hypothetical protein
MTDKCIFCKKKGAGEAKNISFEYKGFRFSSFKDGSTCEACEKKDVIRRFEEFGRKFISSENGKIKVDWEFFSKAYWHEKDSHLIRVLQDVGIFSYKAEGNWELVSPGVCWLNLVKSAGPLYFTREEDVVEFARLNYSYVLYHWEIRQIGKVIERGNKCGKKE